MSGQIADVYKYKNKSYHIIDSNPYTVFDPREYGLKPDTDCYSACWRGYYSKFSIVEKRLFLNKLYIETEDGKYPPVAEVQVKFPNEVDYFTVFSVYEDLSLFVPHTGKMLVGDEFLQEYYIHMGHQRIWAYQDVKEFVFKDGFLTEVNDLSSLAKKLRDESVNKSDLTFCKYRDMEAMKPYLNEWWCK